MDVRRMTLVNLLLVFSTTALAQQAVPSRLYRILTGNKELAKQQILLQLEVDSEKRIKALGDLIAAVNTIAHEAADAGAGELPESTIRLIQLVGSLANPAAVEALVQLLDAKQSELAMLSAEALGQNARREALSALIDHAERPEFTSNYAFRFGLLKSIAQMHDADGVEFLTKVLPSLDGQLAHEVYKFLDQVGPSDFRGNQARFDAWKSGEWQRVQAISRAYDGEFTLSDYGLERYYRPHYYGIEIHAKRLVFVLDRSSSMVDRGRLPQAKHELTRAIRSLPDTTEFAIIVYETTVRVWRKGLVEAKPENKRDAIKFISNIHRGHNTNIYGALKRALDLEDNIEVLFLVSDGAPTTGKIVAPAEIIRDISRLNRFRHIAINSVGISIDGAAEEFMCELASQNGGDYRAVQ